MNTKTVSLIVLAFFASRVAHLQAYGAAPLIIYAFGRMLIPTEGRNSQDKGDVADETVTQKVIEEHITFADVIGAQKAKDALADIVNALKHPEIYKNIGAKMPKGVLLEGNPGNGKTLLAKALASEAGVSFVAINGADFSDKWLGEGVKKVKEFFAHARAKAPCIIFIDEIDAIGMRGQEFGGGAQTENNRVISELLTQLDGMNTDMSKSIIVVGATNNKDRLDPALLRSGRFDIAVRVEEPTLQDRKELFKFYSKKLKLSDAIDFDGIAARTKGFSGADCANLVNQAALCAVRRNVTSVEQSDFIEALETRNIQKR
jgi:cell division protease FtsH